MLHILRHCGDLSVPEATLKSHLRIFEEDIDQTYLRHLSQSALDIIEDYTNTVFLEKIYKQDFEKNNDDIRTYFLKGPLVEILKIQRRGKNDQSVDIKRFSITHHSVTVASHSCIVEVTYKAGMAVSFEALPTPVQQAVFMLIAHLHENRGDQKMEGLPQSVMALLSPYKKVTLP